MMLWICTLEIVCNPEVLNKEVKMYKGDKVKVVKYVRQSDDTEYAGVCYPENPWLVR